MPPQSGPPLGFIYDDGGRRAAGFKGETRDCVTRAIAIGTGLSYKQVYDAINDTARLEHHRPGSRRRSSARTGVHKPTIRKYLDSLGWQWTPTMHIGSGCQVHMRADELPPGRVIVSLSRHIAAVIDGVLRDTHDCAREGTRCVYGYWTDPE